MKKFIKIAPFLLFVPALVFADTPPTAPINSVQDIVQFLCTIFVDLFYALIALSGIMILIAGFNYVTAGDDSEKVSRATKMITYAAIGIGVALLARAIPNIVENFL